MSNSFNQIHPSDHFGWHKTYMDVYDRLFQSVGFDNVLEVGCDGGGGILSYADWFYRNGGGIPQQFISCDISPRPDSLDENKEIIHYQGNAYSLEFVNKALKMHAPYSALIEDGPHTLGTQLFFVEHYAKLLSPDGIGIVEDIQDPAHIAQLHAKLPPGFSGYTVDLRIADNRYDSLLFVIERA